MRYNIIIVSPFGYEHSRVFLELGELIYYSIIELGFDASFKFEEIDWLSPNKASLLATSGGVNIVLGAHLLDETWIPFLHPETIIVNTEQIGATMWTKRIFEFARNFEVWDYSPRNIIKLNDEHVKKVKHLRLGYQPELRRIIRNRQQDIDVLFYGSIAPGDRREVILNSLADCGLNVHRSFGVYGAERDELISRSKIVINIHNYDTHIFESVRVFYLLTNSIPVVGEVNQSTMIDPAILEGIYPAKYEELVETCVKLVGSNGLLESFRENLSYTKYPQPLFTSELLN